MVHETNKSSLASSVRTSTRPCALDRESDRKRSGPRVTCQSLRQLFSHAVKDSVPVPRRCLTKEAHAGIPGTVLALEQPTPVRHERERDPDRNSQRTGK